MQQPLHGLKVIAVEQFLTGPYCTMLMAYAGAEVIKIEKPHSGDPRRQMPPVFKDEHGEKMSACFMEYNCRKKSLTLDLKKEKGQEILKELAAKSDLLVENYRPGVMERLGLGYSVLQEVNPALIYLSISGFGQMEGFRGPFWQDPTFDLITEAMSGYMEMIGTPESPPQPSIFGLADLVTAIYALGGAMIALVDRLRTGRGRYVDMSMYDAMVSLNERAMMFYSFLGEAPRRGTEKIIGPRGVFKAKDGYIVLNTPADYMWERLAEAIGRADLIRDKRFADGPSRAAHQKQHLQPAIEEWLQEKTKQEAIDLLLEKGVPAGAVQTVEEVARCPQIEARQLLVTAEHKVTGEKTLVGSPLRFSGVPETEDAYSPPELGQHNEEILSELGYTADQIRTFKKEGII
mgnify:CR=1 FL=1